MVYEGTMPSRLFIVARPHSDLSEYLRAQFADDATVTVVLDRRVTTRRHRTVAAAAERRRGERRSRPEVDDRLQAHPFAIVTASAAAESLNAVRQWIEVIHNYVTQIRATLDDHALLRREADTTKQVIDRLGAEVDRSSRELGDIGSELDRVTAIVNDLASYLRGRPGGAARGDPPPTASPEPSRNSGAPP